MVGNVLWFPLAGVWIAIAHLFLGFVGYRLNRNPNFLVRDIGF